MKKTALPAIVVFVFAVLVSLAVVRYSRLAKKYVPPTAIPESFSLSSIEVEKNLEVILAVHIDEEGAVIEDSVVKSSGDPLVDKDALKRALYFRFDPATVGGVPVDSWSTLPVKYQPRDDTTTCKGTK